MNQTSMVVIGELESLMKDSTGGPWECGVYDVYQVQDTERVEKVAGASTIDNGVLIASMRNYLPGLIADARVLHDMSAEGEHSARLALAKLKQRVRADAEMLACHARSGTIPPIAIFAAIGSLLDAIGDDIGKKRL